MVKKVTAPKTYDPGKGRPKEHLAYLNEREMAYLRSINGNNMERGPRGLPSFPPDDSLGSSSRSGTASGTSTSKTTGGGGQPGAGGQRGAGSNYGPGSARPGTTSSPSAAGGQRGVTSGTQTAASISSGRAPSSPMAGQGASFSSPVFALGANRDYIDRQRAAMADASSAIRSNKAAKGDLMSGGIRTLNVGPIGTPVSVSRPLTPAASRNVNPAATSIAQSLKYSSPIGPAYGPDEIARLNKAEEDLRSFLKYGPTPTPTGSPIMAGGVPTVSPNKALLGAGYGTFNVPQVPRSVTPAPQIAGNALPSFDIPGPVDVSRVYGYGPQLPGEEKILGVEDVPPENETIAMKTSITEPAAVTAALQRPTYAAGTYTSPYDVPEIVASRIGTRKGLGLKGATTYGMTSYEPGDYAAYRDGMDGYTGVDEAATADASYPSDQPEESPFRITGGRFYDAAKKKLSDYLPSFPSLTGGPGSDYSRFTSDNDRGPIRRKPFQVAQSTSGVGFGGGRGGGGSSGRPQQYYNWDAGVGVPSPGDSDYTLYLKYLQEKAAAQAAVS